MGKGAGEAENAGFIGTVWIVAFMRMEWWGRVCCGADCLRAGRAGYKDEKDFPLFFFHIRYRLGQAA